MLRSNLPSHQPKCCRKARDEAQFSYATLSPCDFGIIMLSVHMAHEMNAGWRGLCIVAYLRSENIDRISVKCGIGHVY